VARTSLLCVYRYAYPSRAAFLPLEAINLSSSSAPSSPPLYARHSPHTHTDSYPQHSLVEGRPGVLTLLERRAERCKLDSNWHELGRWNVGVDVRSDAGWGVPSSSFSLYLSCGGCGLRRSVEAVALSDSVSSVSFLPHRRHVLVQPRLQRRHPTAPTSPRERPRTDLLVHPNAASPTTLLRCSSFLSAPCPILRRPLSQLILRETCPFVPRRPSVRWEAGVWRGEVREVQRRRGSLALSRPHKLSHRQRAGLGRSSLRDSQGSIRVHDQVSPLDEAVTTEELMWSRTDAKVAPGTIGAARLVRQWAQLSQSGDVVDVEAFNPAVAGVDMYLASLDLEVSLTPSLLHDGADMVVG
jgi:hypothetical protein